MNVDTMATKYLNLRFKFGGILVSEIGLILKKKLNQGTEPSIQEKVEPSAQENAEEDIDNDSICSG
ncbi:hypothetical protein KY290_025621 [Solanum tuberosum]|uniref:Uncharacterized protein n=1 Tax=Solanum tuberosum TaxID=4113 RepID=A0ABQ7UU31_SOLTU|nr:hypothetical protein KY290_025621 [Solanum tuberosum]